MEKMQIVLASASPRRTELMKNKNIDFIVCPSTADEKEPINNGMAEAVMSLALQKALDVEGKMLAGEIPETAANEDTYIISADTVVYSNRIIGKPADKNDALKILMELAGKKHYVATGVSIVCTGKPLRCTFYEKTAVYFKDYTPDELADYLNTDEPYDKAGAYAIQGYFKKFIEKFSGDYDNVVGFPIDRINREFQKLTGQKLY